RDRLGLAPRGARVDVPKDRLTISYFTSVLPVVYCRRTLTFGVFDMPRINQAEERRMQLLPILARTFAELGYRRTTTAELAKRCGVRENILYRLWRDKKAMFVASIEFVYALSADTWRRLLRSEPDPRLAAKRLLQYESQHHGETGLQRLVFTGLGETNDPEIR